MAEGTVFDGCRLPPGTWRVVSDCVASGLDTRELEVGQLQELVAQARARHPTWRVPTARKLAALIEFLSRRGVLHRVLSLERDDGTPGITDLFLFRINQSRGVHDGRFVEVKRRVRQPRFKERLLPSQVREILQLRGLGLRAGVVYLDEVAE